MRLRRSAPRLYAATMGRASKIMAPTSCLTGQVHRLPDAPEAYGAMISRPMAAPAQSRSTALVGEAPAVLARPRLELTCVWTLFKFPIGEATLAPHASYLRVTITEEWRDQAT